MFHKTSLLCLKKNEAQYLIKISMSDFKADEPAPVGNYDLRKQEEERRLHNVLERLNTLFLELSPPGPSSAAGSVDQV